MKRPIKFLRHFFFDEECTKYSHSSEWGPNIGNVAFTSPSSNNFAYHYIDVQYTGLNDKNDIELFEGDIIKNQIGTMFIIQWGEYGFEVNNYRILSINNFNKVGGNQKYPLAEYLKLLKMANVSIVRIGNIYETPEYIKLPTA